MTDNEIIKAYGCCYLSHDECGGCDNCPCKIEGDCIMPSAFELEREVFNLLNRQKAEIERLKKGWKADVIEASNIKDEAVREVAERIKNSAYVSEVVEYIGKVYTISETAINNAINETAGES